MGVKCKVLGILVSTIFLLSYNDGISGRNPSTDLLPIRTEQANGCRYTDSLALVKFNQDANGQNWLIKWDFTQPIDTWFGVELNNAGCVRCIDLDGNDDCNINLSIGNGLTGIITRSIDDFTSLEKLLLGSNKITGFIPEELFAINTLQAVDLFGNNMIGPLPAAVGQATELVTLSIGSNDFSGRIPTTIENLTKLEELYLDNNELLGSIPSQIEFLVSLKHLRLDNNNISGEIPIEIKGLENILTINIANNNISGDIPVEIGLLETIEEIIATSNEITSNIPSSIGDLKNLRKLFLGQNNIIGPLPSRIGDLDNLEDLHLNNNSLEGGIPAEIEGCRKLRDFRINDNKITDDLPDEIGTLDSLRIFYASNNGIIGPLPSSIRRLIRLQELKIANNSMIGPLPNAVGELQNLKILEASNNKFIGPLPNNLGELNRLLELRLDNNTITGPLPANIGDMDVIYVMDFSNNDIEGCFPESLRSKCGREVDFNNNPKLSWEGDFSQFCNALDQFGAPCNDGNSESQDDIIREDCICLGCTVEEIEVEGFICDDSYVIVNGERYSEAGVFEFQGTTKLGCDSLTKVTISQMALSITTEDVTCPEEKTGSVSIECGWNGDFQYELKNEDGFIVAQSNSSTELPSIQNELAPGHYSLIVNDPNVNCEIKAEFDIISSIERTPIVDIHKALCPGEILMIGTQQFSTNYRSGEVRLRSSNGCDSIVRVELDYFEFPEAYDDDGETSNSEYEIDILSNDDISSEVTINIIETSKVNTVEVTDQNTLLVMMDGNYSGEAWVEYEICHDACNDLCSRSRVVINKESDGYDDGVLTPNDDGFNDVLVVTGYSAYEEISNSKINVVNRWGQVVYSTENYKNDWAGFLNGDSSKPLPEGVYYYHLVYKTGKSIMGSRSLIR